MAKDNQHFNDMEYAPKMFTRGTNNTFTILRAGPTPMSLCFVSVHPDGVSYGRTFTESECNKVTSNLEWPKLLELMQSGFVENRCTSSAEADSCYFEVPSVGMFTLPKSKDANGETMILSNIVSYSRFKLVKDPDKLIKEVSNKEAKASKKLEDSAFEVNKLKECFSNNESKKVLDDLKNIESEIKRADKHKKSKGVENAKDDPEEEVTAVRNPLGSKMCVEYNANLLKILKTDLWQPQSEEGDTPTNPKFSNVIPLYSVAEFGEIKKNFPDQTCSIVYNLIQKLGDWDFNVFDVQAALSGSYGYEGLVSQPNGGSLFIVTYCVFVKNRLLEKFNINEKIFLNWLSIVEAGYHPNPYHNSMHAADVLHVTNFIITSGGLSAIAKLSDEEIFAALFSAAIHDYNHPGINNNFHIKAQTYLATLFNDKSILESVHLSCVFELMKLDQYNVLECFCEEQRRNIKDTIIEMVLATDMGLHAKIISTFKRKLVEDSTFSKKEDVRLALSMAMKMADISNCGRPEDLYLKWCDHISDEFYLQGDREQAMGQVISPFMDRYTPSVAKGQIAFMNYIVIPLFECMSEFLPEMHFTIDFCENNKAYWGAK